MQVHIIYVPMYVHTKTGAGATLGARPTESIERVLQFETLWQAFTTYGYVLRNVYGGEAFRKKRKCDVVGHHDPGGPTRLRLDFSLSLRPEHWERHDARPWLHSRSARGSRASRDKKVQNLSHTFPIIGTEKHVHTVCMYMYCMRHHEL